SDVEGSWARLSSFVERTPGLSFADGDRIEVAADVVFVMGGDAVDRGPASRRVLRALLDVKERQPDRVVLLAGNRDLNKLRLVRELEGSLPKKAPPEVRALLSSSRADVLRWIFAHTMGAQQAFDLRREELVTDGDRAEDDDVVDSFLQDLRPPSGLHFRYLQRCQLAFRHGATLFVHGGFADEALGHVPGQPPVGDVDDWVHGLNAFCAEQLARYAEQPGRVIVGGDDVEPQWLPLVLYQAPVKGLGRNPHSVVYGRFGSDPWNNPRLPSASSLRWLRERGVRRVVVGHTPCGDLPAFLKSAQGCEVVIADNSRGRVDVGLSLTITDDVVSVRARTLLDDGRDLDLAYVVAALDDGVTGRITADGHLVKAVVAGVVDDGAAGLLFRCDKGYVVRQTAHAQAGLGPLRAPVDVDGAAS
ncbi:MAG: hypothetical protein FJ137_20010, partial [Deltaproteobacteria bacterium]|nr:hypothetical protein [Deltaproteobacteria bacterium]